MLTYNTQMRPLRLPEYGRNIQSMVDYCLTISDREERTVCAYSIIDAMANMFPELRSGEESDHKLWDHLMIMSDFQLDIDFPCEVITEDNLYSLPDHVPYDNNQFRFRHYGRNTEEMIMRASEMEPSQERDDLVFLIANHMKKLMMNFNPEGVDDARIFNDLRVLSHGAINFTPEEMKLKQYIEPPKTTGKKKKKK